MKLTKASKKELFNCHSGVGVLFLNLGNNTIASVDFWLGRNGTFYTSAGPTKNKPLDTYLCELRKEIDDDKMHSLSLG